MKFRLSDFRKLEILGEGTFGLVLKIENKSTKEIYALKVIKKAHDDGISANVLREIIILKQLVHPNIVVLEDVIIEKESISLVFEYIDLDLRDYLITNGTLEMKTVQRFAYQIIQGTLFFHLKGFIHRDLKPQNLLVNIENLTIKIADFGSTRKCGLPSTRMTEPVVTLWYRPAELLLGDEKYSSAVDVWSIGCIIYEMMTKKPIFKGDSQIGQLFSIFKILGTPKEKDLGNMTRFPEYTPNFPNWKSNLDEKLNFQGPINDLLKKIFVYNEVKRISTRGCLLHPYFDTMNKSEVPASNLERTPCPFNTLVFSDRLKDDEYE